MVETVAPDPLPSPVKLFRPSWSLLTADFLDSRGSTFLWNFARGTLPLRSRHFTRATLTPRCPICLAPETVRHAFFGCILPVALIQRLTSGYLRLLNVTFTSGYLNPIPSSRESRNMFVLPAADIVFQVWRARCSAAHGEAPTGLHTALARVRTEVWFYLQRELRTLGPTEFSRRWCRSEVIFKRNPGGEIKITF
ncbi:unnamed protein product [Ixodes pacificus]